MEPITSWTIATVATILVNKGLETAGSKLGEGVVKLTQHLLSLLKQKKPETAAALEQASIELAPQQVTALSQQMEQAAADPEIKQAVDAVAADPNARAVVQGLIQQSGGSGVLNLGKIGVVNTGSVANQTNNINI